MSPLFKAIPGAHSASVQSGDGQSQSPADPGGNHLHYVSKYSKKQRQKNSNLWICVCVNLCRSIWRRHHGPQHRLRSGQSTPIRPQEIKYSASCACAPQLWTCSAWPMRTLYPGRTTLSLCSSLCWLKWVKRHDHRVIMLIIALSVLCIL